MILDVFKQLCIKYSTAFYHAWCARKKQPNFHRKKEEIDFLPAHLELIEKPISNLPKWSARLIIIFIVIILIWSIFAKIDIVVVARGKTNLYGKSKVIQSIETSVVESIKVRNGDKVKKGQILVELSGLGSNSDFTQSIELLQSLKLSKLRNQALIKGIEERKVPSIDRKAALSFGIPNDKIIKAEQLLGNQYATWYMQDSQLRSILRQKESEKLSIKSQIIKLSKLNKLNQKKLRDSKKLVHKHFISKHAYYQQKAEEIQSKNDLSSQSAQLRKINAAIEEAKQNILINTQVLKRDTMDTLRKDDDQLQQIANQVEKFTQRKKWLTLTSPVDGTVQELSITTQGGVVTAAQKVMVIVPDKDSIEIEATIENKDIGFIRPGQKVVIKIDSFPYTRYGFITGELTHVSYDAIKDEKLGLVFSCIINLDRNYLTIQGKKVYLKSGLAVTAEIKTGKRRVIDYLLSPLRTEINSSFRER